MSISSEINRIKTNILNAYDKCEAKGATIPTDKNSANLATTIDSITGGTKYGITIDTILGDVDSTGKLQLPSPLLNSDIVFNGVTDIVDYCLQYRFSNIRSIKSISFPDLEKISGLYACDHLFYSSNFVASISFPKLTTISGTSACSSMFAGCASLTSISFPNLTTISALSGCSQMFQTCLYLTTASFPKLDTISGNNCCQYMFGTCSRLSDVYFNSIKSNSFGSYKTQFSNLLNGTGTTTTHTLHFPSNMESTISTLTGYPLFGGTSGYVVLAFDLPATE